MPNCLCMPFYYKPRSVKDNPVPYLVQIELTYISILFCIIDPNVSGFFNSSGNAIVLPPHYLEISLNGGMACVDAMIMYRGWFLYVLLESFCKGSRGFPYVLIITCKVPTLEPVDGPTCVNHGILVLVGDQ